MNMDQFYYVERLIIDGEAPVTQALSLPGGSAANTIYGLAKLGIRTGFVGAIGEDETGEKLLADLRSVGVDTSRIRTKKGARTGSVLCLSDKRGRRSLYVMPGANSLLGLDDVDLGYVNGAGILHLSSFVDEQQLEVQKQVLASLAPSVQVSFAPGEIDVARGLDSLSPLLKRTSLLFVNRNEIEQLTGVDFIAGAKQCLQLGCRIVVITLGKGISLPQTDRREKLICHIATESKEFDVKAPTKRKIHSAETTGAGDAFAAGFIYGFLQGKGLQECGMLGDTMASFCISQIGARTGLPSPAELTRKYQELWENT